MVYFLLPFKQRAYIVILAVAVCRREIFSVKKKIGNMQKSYKKIKIILLSTKWMKTKFEISKNFQFLEMPLVLVYHVGKNFTSISVHQNIDRQNISFNLSHWFGVLKSQLYIVLFFNCMFFSWDDPWLTTILNNTGWQAKFLIDAHLRIQS